MFRYYLSGADVVWASSPTGEVRYPMVPTGHHELRAVAYDPLSHSSSPPLLVSFDIAPPWWSSWWARTTYLMAVAGAFWSIIKLRERSARITTRRLERLVLARTAEIEAKSTELMAAQAELRRQATLDGLTGLLNRAEVQRRLSDRLAGATLPDRPVVALIDLDHFKNINDRHGHLGGDQVLAQLGAAIRDILGEGEYAGRYGGEELILVMTDVDGRALSRVQSFHEGVRGQKTIIDGVAVGVSCSIGVTRLEHLDSWTSLIGRVDSALYAAKRSGRDCVIFVPRSEIEGRSSAGNSLTLAEKRSGLGD